MFFSSADFYFKTKFVKKIISEILSNGLDPDQD